MKTALIFGSSGLVGKNLLNQIINNSNYSKVKIFVRSSLEISDPKVEIINTDFKDLQKIKNLIIGDDCFFCIGTTKKNSPDRNEYRRIELDLPKKIAQISKSNDIRSFIYVSSGFADPNNSGDYLKFKGLVEEEIKSLNFEKIGILRPSFLLGNRKEKRVGEKIGIFIFKLLSPLFFGPIKKMKPIHSEKVAKAMIKIANENLGKTILESDEIVEISSG
ncbi:NAD(P)H-binding protein [Candidatus Pelagibacter sp.]|nr:NAD(P)H-binding protein [Candidatus Pelagibacter sp.]